MALPRPTAYRNGHSKNNEAPLQPSGASTAPQPRQQRTTFPQDVRLWGSGAFFYLIHRFQFGGVPAARWLAFLWLALAALWTTGVFPARWIGTGVWLLVFVLQIVIGMRARRGDYIRFTPVQAPAMDAAPLAPSEKLAVHATGLLNVEGKYQRFAWLPGFYRTFATGEHAVLCLARERRRWVLLSSPPEEAGMWYAFIEPDSLLDLRWGNLTFGTNESPAVAATYRLTIPANDQRKQPVVREETIYLAFGSQEDGQRLYVDLAQHLPESASTRDAAPISQQ